MRNLLHLSSSEARGEAIASSPHWSVNQNAEQEKHHVFSASETVFLH